MTIRGSLGASLKDVAAATETTANLAVLAKNTATTNGMIHMAVNVEHAIIFATNITNQHGISFHLSHRNHLCIFRVNFVVLLYVAEERFAVRTGSNIEMRCRFHK